MNGRAVSNIAFASNDPIFECDKENEIEAAFDDQSPSTEKQHFVHHHLASLVPSPDAQ